MKAPEREGSCKKVNQQKTPGFTAVCFEAGLNLHLPTLSMYFNQHILKKKKHRPGTFYSLSS